MSSEILCPVCSKPMENLGNVSGIFYTSTIPQWDDVYVCRDDKVKKTVRKHGYMPSPGCSFAYECTEVKNFE